MSKYVETEVKFKIQDKEKFIKKLEEIGAQKTGEAFEKTIRFDSKDNSLESEGKFLRLRSGFKNVITLKRKLSDGQYRSREETEFEIEDIAKMQYILENLGFLGSKIMEKYRQKWILKDVEIVIDTLPMGDFIEIEGKRDDITSAINLLGLDEKEKILDTYWEIWFEYSKENGLNKDQITFKKNH